MSGTELFVARLLFACFAGAIFALGTWGLLTLLGWTDNFWYAGHLNEHFVSIGLAYALGAYMGVKAGEDQR